MNDQAFTGKSSKSVDIIRADPAVFRSLALTFSTNVKSRAINVVLAKRRRAELKAARDAARDARREAARRAEELAKRLAEQKPKWKEAWEEEPKPDQEWEADWEGKGDAIASSIECALRINVSVTAKSSKYVASILASEFSSKKRP